MHGKGERYFGVELEIDIGGHDDDNAESILEVGNASDDCIYIKSDGSLNEGMEIVTHPMSLEYHMNYHWGDLMNECVHLGYRSHQTSNCGLHIHVNRSSLGDYTEHQEATISRILYFVEQHWNELLKFSRRSESAMNRWAARYGYESSPKKLLDKAKERYGRYSAVNLCNHHTIEFRMFRGTLKLNTLLATLQMVNHICDVAFSLSDVELQELSWSDFVASVAESELIQYASTQSIMEKVLKACGLLRFDYEILEVKNGDILKMDAWGNLSGDTFQTMFYDPFFRYCPWEENEPDEALEMLLLMCHCFGVTEDEVMELVEMGYSYDEIEGVLNEPKGLRSIPAL